MMEQDKCLIFICKVHTKLYSAVSLLHPVYNRYSLDATVMEELKNYEILSIIMKDAFNIFS